MKKQLLALGLVLCLAACSNTSTTTEDNKVQEQVEETSNVIIVAQDIDVDSVRSFLLDSGTFTMGVNAISVNEQDPDLFDSGYSQNAIIAIKDDKYGFYDYEGNELLECSLYNVMEAGDIFQAYTNEMDCYKVDKDFKGYSGIAGIGGDYPTYTIENGEVMAWGSSATTPIISSLDDDVLFLVDSENGSGIIDQDANILCEMDGWYSSPGSTLSDGYTFLSDTAWTYNTDTWEYEHGNLMLFDTDGQQLLDEPVEDAGFMWNGYAPVKKDGKWGFIDDLGNLVIDYIFDDASSLNEGRAYVKYNGSWMIIDIDASLEQGDITTDTIDKALKEMTV